MEASGNDGILLAGFANRVIDTVLIEGMSRRAAARRFGVSESAAIVERPKTKGEANIKPPFAVCSLATSRQRNGAKSCVLSTLQCDMRLAGKSLWSKWT